MAAVIKTVNLTKRYGTLVALSNLNLEINEGDCFGFIGPNGAGKTTTIKILATLLQPTWGEARVCDYVVGYQSRLDPAADRVRAGLFRRVRRHGGAGIPGIFRGRVQHQRRQRTKIVNDVLELTDLGYKRDAAGGRAVARDEAEAVDRPGAGARSEGAAAGRAGGQSRPAGADRDARAC